MSCANEIIELIDELLRVKEWQPRDEKECKVDRELDGRDDIEDFAAVT